MNPWSDKGRRTCNLKVVNSTLNKKTWQKPGLFI
jgi:hypothetical protein